MQILVVLCVGLNFGCSMETVDSDLVNPEKIHQNYIVSYDADSAATSIWAQFRLGSAFGDTIHLVEPARLIVNNKKIHSTWFPVIGTYYSERIANTFQDNVVIDFYGPDESLFRNQIGMKPITVNATSTEVNTASNYVVSVNTDSLESRDAIEATISQNQPSSNGESKWITVSGSYSPSKKTITFYSSNMKDKFIDGMATLDVVRIHNGHLQAATSVGGNIRSEYSARTISLEITNARDTTLANNP